MTEKTTISLLEGLKTYCKNTNLLDQVDALDNAIEAVKQQKTQKTAQWESDPYEYIGSVCSRCGARWVEPQINKVFKYCPSCGARMESKE